MCPLLRGLPRRSPLNRRNTKKPHHASALRMVIESLETRAMLAGVGPESWSAPGLAPAPLSTGSLFSSEVILSCSSPTPGSSGTSSPPAPTSGSGGTTSGGDLWLAFSGGSGAGGSKSGSTVGVSTDGPALSSQYNGGSGAGGQGNGTVGTLTNAELWRLYWSGAGTGSSSSSSDEGSLADDPTISAQYTSGSGIGGITPLVYNPESDGPPVFHSGVWTGDEGGVQFVQTADTGNKGTGEGDASESDGKSRARSWWGIRGWFLGDDPIDEGGSQVVPTSEGGNAHEDRAPDGEPEGNPSPLRLPRNTGWFQFTSMGERGWGDDAPLIRLGDIEAARGLTGLAKMIYDHGRPVSSRSADSNGRVIVYTFADGSRYMEPVEPPSEQHIDSTLAMIPGGIALKSGKGVFVASGAVAAELVEDAVTNRAREAADDATGGRLAWIPHPILAILLGARPKAKPGVLDDAGDLAKRADDLSEGRRLAGQWDAGNYPTPPGRSADWTWAPGSSEGRTGWRWWDPQGGEWRWHPSDSWHPNGHWDHNPWQTWNDRWRNVDVPSGGNPAASP